MPSNCICYAYALLHRQAHCSMNVSYSRRDSLRSSMTSDVTKVMSKASAKP